MEDIIDKILSKFRGLVFKYKYVILVLVLISVGIYALDYIKSCGGNKFDIIFIDPPYASGLYAKVLRALNLSKMLKPSTLIVCESDYDFISDDPDLETIFYTKKTARYGRAVVTILAPRKDGM